MPARCPKCSRAAPDGRGACIYCGASLAGAPAAPLAAPERDPREPDTIRSAEDIGRMIQLAGERRSQGRADDAARIMARLVREIALDDLGRIILLAAEQWAASVKPYLSEEALGGARQALAEAARTAKEEKLQAALGSIDLALRAVPAGRPQHPALGMIRLGLAAALSGAGAAPPPPAASEADKAYGELVRRAVEAMLKPGGQQEAAALFQKALALIPDPPVTQRDRVRRERILGFLKTFAKGSAAPAPPPASPPRAGPNKPAF